MVDYGLGNIFSIQQACRVVGIDTVVTSSIHEIQNADAVFFPGVGAFGDAMAALRRLDLVAVLQDVAVSGKPLIGICLGLQLLMDRSYEFGLHEGLSLISGDVVSLKTDGSEVKTKIPHVGWNPIEPTQLQSQTVPLWSETPLSGLSSGEHMYFVHSYHVLPADMSLVLAVTKYGDTEFCSTLQRNNVVGFQFHPERSGLRGLEIYRNLKNFIYKYSKANH